MENKVLTLQEKMVKIRSEIPALVKRAYSEEVNYDFTKIDDIFRYLTPAMNKWKVNLDIVSESASKRNENGDAVYVEFLAYCQMWLYEADLVLKWINAENPDDVITVTIHAIGTHEMPEKAKGSAWTYTIKYYLLDKYCIDQGGEDPDMRDFPPDTYDGAGPEYDDMTIDTYDLPDDSSEGIAGSTAETTDVEQDAGAEGDMEDPGEESSGEPGEDPGVELSGKPSGEPGEEPVEEPEQKEADTSEYGSLGSDSGMGEESSQEEASTEEGAEPNNQSPVADTKKTGKKAAKDGQNADKRSPDRPAPSRHIMPENGQMVNLPNGVSPQPAINMTVEEAGNIVCTFGIHNNQSLSELMEQGEEGIKGLEWIAYRYRGKNETIRQGARLLLSTLQAA